MFSDSKSYRISQKEDVDLLNEAKELLDSKIQLISEKIGMNPLPDESIPLGKGMIARSLSVGNYGFKTWGDLFNPKQQLVLVTFVEKINQAYEKMLSEGLDKDYAKALVSYLTLNLGRLLHVYSGLGAGILEQKCSRSIWSSNYISTRGMWGN